MGFFTKPEVIFPGLLYIQYDTQYEVASTFLRLQEFYESSYKNIKGKYFELDEYMDTYAADKGNFTYTSDWSGFNVPGNVVDAFHELYVERMLAKEYALFDLITEHTDEWNKYYVIASSKDGGKHDAIDVLKHEIAHGMYYLNSDYRDEMDERTDTAALAQPKLVEKILEMGYCEDVVMDEIQAYFSTSSMTYLADDGFEGIDIPWNHVLECQRIFERYYEELVEK